MPFSHDELTEVLGRHRWTAHNIRLAPGVETLPGTPEFLKGSSHLRAVLGTLDLIFPAGLSGVRIADLGCLEGGYSLALALRGADVTGIEARAENVAKCRVLEEHFELPNLRFVEDDVKNFTASAYGSFDAVLALGILYHLDSPASWIRQISRGCSRALLVETHYAPEDDAAVLELRPVIRKLGPIENMNVAGTAYRGRWFEEYRTEEERDGMPWASFSNPSSFWLTRRSILEALRDSGFALLYEQYDHWLERWEVIVREYPRSLFVGVRREDQEIGRPDLRG